MIEFNGEIQTKSIDDVLKEHAGSFLESIIVQARHNKLFRAEKGEDYGAEESLLQKYEICRHNGCSSTEFHRELISYAGRGLKDFPTYESVLLGLGVSQSALGVIGRAPSLIFGGALFSVYALFQIYKKRVISKKLGRFREILDYYSKHPEFIDEVLRRYKNG